MCCGEGLFLSLLMFFTLSPILNLTVCGRFVPWSFRSKYKKFFRAEPEISLIG